MSYSEDWKTSNRNPANWPGTRLLEDVRGGECETYLKEDDDGRPQIVAFNEGGLNWTEVDLLDVLDWADENYELVAELRRKAAQ